MAGLVTKETNRDVYKFIESIENETKRSDSLKLIDMIKKVSNLEPKIWGNEKVPDFLIGFGNYNYKRKNGNEAYEWFNLGFAPRKTKITLYLTFDISKEEDLLKQLGKCKWGKGCLYINRLKDVDLKVLEKLIKKSASSNWYAK